MPSWIKDIKPGFLVKCVSTKLKHFDFNSTYKVAEYKHFKVRIEGFKHFVLYHNFMPADIKEVRAEKIKVLNGEKPRPKDISTRKIDRNKNIEEKKFKLFEMLLSRWFTDRKNLEYNSWYSTDAFFSYEEFIDKIVKKDKSKFGVTIEDFELIKDMKISEAFDLYIKIKTGKIK